MSSVSAVILCYNESKNIGHCLESVKGFCDIFVVDSGSTDDTVEIAGKYTSNIVVHEYQNHASQWQWALKNLDFDTEWIIALDSDFVVTEELKKQINDELESLPDNINGIYVKHNYVFGGGNVRFGGTKQYWLRIVRHKTANADLSDLVDFRFIVPGDTRRFDSAVVEYNRYDDDISTWLNKQDKFSIRLAIEEEMRRRKLIEWGVKPDLFGNPDERFMWLRDRWLSLPLFIRPVVYFIYRYIIMLGFLDGRAGFLYHFLQGFWLRVVIDWKIMQIRKLGLDDEGIRYFKNEILLVREGSVDTAYKKYLVSRDKS